MGRREAEGERQNRDQIRVVQFSARYYVKQFLTKSHTFYDCCTTILLNAEDVPPP